MCIRDRSASDDPVNAVSLSVANEQKELLQRYTENADAADARLSLADVSIQEAVNTLRRITELSIQAGSGTVNETAILKEVDALKEVIVKIGNAILLTNLTTASGFATFILTKSKVLQEFGILASLNMNSNVLDLGIGRPFNNVRKV